MLKSGYFLPLVVIGLLANLALAAVVPSEKDLKLEEEKIRYDNYKVYKVTIDTEEQYNELMAQEGDLEVKNSNTFSLKNI